MKKILSILSSLMISASAASTVLACSTVPAQKNIDNSQSEAIRNQAVDSLKSYIVADQFGTDLGKTIEANTDLNSENFSTPSKDVFKNMNLNGTLGKDVVHLYELNKKVNDIVSKLPNSIQEEIKPYLDWTPYLDAFGSTIKDLPKQINRSNINAVLQLLPTTLLETAGLIPSFPDDGNGISRIINKLTDSKVVKALANLDLNNGLKLIADDATTDKADLTMTYVLKDGLDSLIKLGDDVFSGYTINPPKDDNYRESGDPTDTSKDNAISYFLGKEILSKLLNGESIDTGSIGNNLLKSLPAIILRYDQIINNLSKFVTSIVLTLNTYFQMTMNSDYELNEAPDQDHLFTMPGKKDDDAKTSDADVFYTYDRAKVNINENNIVTVNDSEVKLSLDRTVYGIVTLLSQTDSKSFGIQRLTHALFHEIYEYKYTSEPVVFKAGVKDGKPKRLSTSAFDFSTTINGKTDGVDDLQAAFAVSLDPNDKDKINYDATVEYFLPKPTDEEQTIEFKISPKDGNKNFADGQTAQTITVKVPARNAAKTSQDLKHRALAHGSSEAVNRLSYLLIDALKFTNYRVNKSLHAELSSIKIDINIDFYLKELFIGDKDILMSGPISMLQTSGLVIRHKKNGLLGSYESIGELLSVLLLNKNASKADVWSILAKIMGDYKTDNLAIVLKGANPSDSDLNLKDNKMFSMIGWNVLWSRIQGIIVGLLNTVFYTDGKKLFDSLNKLGIDASSLKGTFPLSNRILAAMQNSPLGDLTQFSKILSIDAILNILKTIVIENPIQDPNNTGNKQSLLQQIVGTLEESDESTRGDKWNSYIGYVPNEEAQKVAGYEKDINYISRNSLLGEIADALYPKLGDETADNKDRKVIDPTVIGEEGKQLIKVENLTYVPSATMDAINKFGIKLSKEWSGDDIDDIFEAIVENDKQRQIWTTSNYTNLWFNNDASQLRYGSFDLTFDSTVLGNQIAHLDNDGNTVKLNTHKATYRITYSRVDDNSLFEFKSIERIS